MYAILLTILALAAVKASPGGAPFFACEDISPGQIDIGGGIMFGHSPSGAQGGPAPFSLTRSDNGDGSVGSK